MPEPPTQEPPASGPVVASPTANTCKNGVANPLQRLTSEQYANAVTDLFSLAEPFEGAESFAGDARLDSVRRLKFIGFAQSTSGTQTESFRSAAEELAVLAVRSRGNWAPCIQETEQCRAETVQRLVRRAYRRPATDDELSALHALALSAMSAQMVPEGFTAFESGLALVVEAVLQSPDFIYRVPRQGVALPDAALVRRSDFELAEALAFFLWETLPDEQLLDAAAAGELQTAQQVERQARRMLEDERALSTVVDFYERWLGADKVVGKQLNPALFPGFDEALSRSLLRSFRAFVEHVYREGDRKLTTLMTARTVFFNEPLAAFYGEGTATNPELTSTERGDWHRGLLTHPAFLAAHSSFSRDDPIHRGLIIWERVLCNPMADPPPSAGGSVEPPIGGESLSTREHVATITEQAPECLACHLTFNQPGYALGRFDAAGRYRPEHAGQAIDASGTLLGSGDAQGDFDDAASLIEQIATSAQLRKCMSEMALYSALRRYPNAADSCALTEIEQTLVQTDDLVELLVAVVRSNAFRLRAPRDLACTEVAQ